MSTLPTHGRYDYRPIKGRKSYEWPGGRRLAVYLGLNLEHFAFAEGLGAELAPGGPQPDVLNFAWRDYGDRKSTRLNSSHVSESRMPSSA